MTATPIPRTLALTLYGDLDLSVIDEMPPGRTPIETRWTGRSAACRRVGISAPRNRARAPGLRGLSGDRRIEAGVEGGHGGIRAPRENTSFPKLRVGLLHGRLKSEEKDSVMEQFPPRRNPNSGRDHRDRSRRGRAQRHGDGHRTCRPLRPRATPSAARTHRARHGKIALHSGGAENRSRAKRASASKRWSPPRTDLKSPNAI